MQTPALPLGYAAVAVHTLERETGLEPATFSLARRRSTTELLPLTHHCYSTRVLGFAEEEEPDQQDHHHPPDPVHDPVLPSTPPVAKSHESPRSGTTLEMGIHHLYNTVAIRHLLQRAHVAQVAERVLGKDKVTGSNPVVGSMNHSLRSGSWRRHSAEARVVHALNPSGARGSGRTLCVTRES